MIETHIHTRFREFKENNFGVAGVVLVICRRNPKTNKIEVLVETCHKYNEKTKEGDLSLPMETIMWDGQIREDYKSTITRCLTAELKLRTEDISLTYSPGHFYNEYQFSRFAGETGKGLAVITVLWVPPDKVFPTGIVESEEVQSTKFVAVSELMDTNNQLQFRKYPPQTKDILQTLDAQGFFNQTESSQLVPFKLRPPKYERSLRDFKH